MKHVNRKHSHVVSNENGAAALISVAILSLVVVTTISTVYVYLVNRSKYHSQIREAYALTQVTEELAKMTRQAYDLGVAAVAAGTNCPDGNAPTPIGTSRFCMPANACVQSVSNIQGAQYCINTNSIQTVADNGKIKGLNGNYIAQVVVKETFPKSNIPAAVEKFSAGLDRFFESSSSGVVAAAHGLEPVLAANLTPPTLTGWIIGTAHAQQRLGFCDRYPDSDQCKDVSPPPGQIDRPNPYPMPGPYPGGSGNNGNRLAQICPSNPSLPECQAAVQTCDVPNPTSPLCAQICSGGPQGGMGMGMGGQNGGRTSSLPGFCTAPGQAAVNITPPNSPAYSCGQGTGAAQGVGGGVVINAGSPCIALQIQPANQNTPIRIAFALVNQ